MDGAAEIAKFNLPTALAWSAEGALLVGDLGTGKIRIVNWETGQVNTLNFPAETDQQQLIGKLTTYCLDGDEDTQY